jgi:hypothetical protein
MTPTDFIARQMIGLFWYLSSYAEFDDFSETTRRDFFQDCIDDFHEKLTDDGRAEVLAMLRRHKGYFGSHPYAPRFDRFLDQFIELLRKRGDPALLMADAVTFRKAKNA